MKAQKEIKNGTTHVSFSGEIDEHVNFQQTVGKVEGAVTFNCRGITRINSTGVKLWMGYFQQLAEGGTRFSFEDCSSAIVENLNLFKNFAIGAEVKSVMLPYLCSSCELEQDVAIKTAQLKASGFETPPVKCRKCGSEAVFDDLPDAYFQFLRDK